MKPLAGFLLLLLSSALPAQDTIKLVSGKRLRGDVVKETARDLVMVTRECELKTISLSDIDEVRRGRPLNPALAERISGKDLEVEALVNALVWGGDNKALKSGCQRLARRAIAVDPDCREARLYLGHLRYDGRWYKNQRDADRALAKKMRAEGRVLVKGAWVARAEKRELSRKPGRFMLDGEGRWRLVTELMKERQMILWGGEWYPPEKKGLVDRLKQFEDLVKEPCQAAQEGPTTVVFGGNRESAQRVLKNFRRARAWFDETMLPKSMSFSTGPQSLIVVTKGRTGYEHFLKNGRALHKVDQERVAFCLKRDSMSFGELSRVSNRSEDLWEHTLIAGAGAAMMQLWGHESASVCPSLYVGAGHWAELEVLGEVRIHFAKPSRYDAEIEGPRKYRSLAEAKQIVKSAIGRGRLIPVEKLFATSLGGLSYLHEAQGLFLLRYLQAEHPAGLRSFVAGKGPSSLRERFVAAFAKQPAEIDGLFKAWFRKLP